MTVHEQELASCVDKAAFDEKEDVKAAAKRMRKTKKAAIEFYQCAFCKKWHLGNSSGKSVQAWEPRKEQDRPTEERRATGDWVFAATERAGKKVARDMGSTPIDRMEFAGVLSNDQASAGRDFEELYRRAIETPGTRDSCTIWEPKGHDETDGPVEAVRDRKELYMFLGTYRDRILRFVCVEHNDPRPKDVGVLRECLNECARFFKT